MALPLGGFKCHHLVSWPEPDLNRSCPEGTKHKYGRRPRLRPFVGPV